jgi:hypothetical protein
VEKILGLDISTSITGVALLNEDGSIYKLFSIDLRKLETFWQKVDFIQNKLEEIKRDENIGHVFIEPALVSMRRGKSSAHTISILLKINGIVSWLCWRLFNMEPIYISAISARNKCGIKIKRGEKAKPIVMKFLFDNDEPFTKWITFTKQGNPKPGSYDIADAYVIARAGFLDLTKKKKKRIVKSEP